MTIQTPTVSIVTLLKNRVNFIPLLRYCIYRQTYPLEYIEWVIVDDGDFDKSNEFIDDFATYIKVNKNINLGRKRQMACDIASGEFIIFFDDDDFHFPQRIENSVKKLQKLGSRFVAGNSRMLICDISSGYVYSTGPFHKNHCTAGTMCFRKEILEGTCFRASDISGEEAFFLKNWKIPVVQLDSSETIICLAHNENTVNKNHLLKKDKIEKKIEDYALSEDFYNILKKIKKIIN